MNVGVIQPVQIRILADLIIKRNHNRTTLDQSHSGCSIRNKPQLCLSYTDHLRHFGTVCIRLLEKCHKLRVCKHGGRRVVL